MQKKTIYKFYGTLEEVLTEKSFLKKIELSKKELLSVLANGQMKDSTFEILSSGDFSCLNIFCKMQKTLSAIAPELSGKEPSENLSAVYQYIISTLFDRNTSRICSEAQSRAFILYLHSLQHFFAFERAHKPFSRDISFQELTDEEISGCNAETEYRRFQEFWQKQYVYELMRIGLEVTPFNTLGHIAGVHFVSMHMARQLKALGVPIDLSLTSAVAAGHDLGKFGCRPEEAGRVPYLHYYYTDICLKKYGMPLIAHIASNHSTWDLELENLSSEALILIYSDFRVKSTRSPEGEEIVNFYSLDESFDVILNKLDNVDEAKKLRYMRVYSKLKDFEDYMLSIGVDTDIGDISNLQLSASAPKTRSLPQSIPQPNNITSESDFSSGSYSPSACVEKKDASLLHPDEVIISLKNLAIEHNLAVMSQFNSETAFANLLETARTESQWKSTRAYINILDEYCTYLTPHQKVMTLYFLHDLLMHHEGDIRRQSAALMGEIIARYDEKRTKELPADITPEALEVTSLSLWKKYLNLLLFPGHKVTEQQRMRIGFTVKIMMDSAFRCTTEKRAFLECFLAYLQDKTLDNLSTFVILDSLSGLPLELCSEGELSDMIDFCKVMGVREPTEIKLAALRFLCFAAETASNTSLNKALHEAALTLTAPKHFNTAPASVLFLKNKILSNLGHSSFADFISEMCEDRDTISEIFLENLKLGTPWMVKSVNIDLLLEVLRAKKSSEALHIATHLSNLVKVSERVSVRHKAGEGLIEAIQFLPLDQRNEIAVELTKGLELGDYQFSKYIPDYLGVISTFLHPNEMDELLSDVFKMVDSTNEKISAVSLDTLGVLLQNYPAYKGSFGESEEQYSRRYHRVLGAILKGLSNYNPVVTQEAFMVIGQYLFASNKLTLRQKNNIFRVIYKKMLTLISEHKESGLSFFNNAAALNHIYRFISDYLMKYGSFNFKESPKAAFFPGTFDPFSLSHKGIVTAIRDLGFDVYLALDEFSWSKKTQPHMLRRKIVTMSVADEENVYVFPDDIPVNIASPQDLIRLRRIFSGRDLYIAVGSDVIENASSYKAPPAEGSIHSLNHVVFKRESTGASDAPKSELQKGYDSISGDITELTLPTHLEDISSTRIRENIDNNRDISNLIDTVAQNFIYDNGLYLREPQYKAVLQQTDLLFDALQHRDIQVFDRFLLKLRREGHLSDKISQHLSKPDVRSITIRDGAKGGEIIAAAAVHELDSKQLYQEFRDADLAEYIRQSASGKIAVIGGIYFRRKSAVKRLPQMILTEALAACLKEDFAYAIYINPEKPYIDSKTADLLDRQGFIRISKEKSTDIFAVNMKRPITLLQNIDRTLKDPFDKNKNVSRVIESTYAALQRSMTKLYPGELVLSLDSGVMHHKIINMITAENGVPATPQKVRKLGPYMCVPFGKILRGMVVPNTVTKTLHTEKCYNADLSKFTIEEAPFYSSIVNQTMTIKSFNRPVILVDDLLHHGHRIRKLNEALVDTNSDVYKIIVGILSGMGRDMMLIQGRDVESAYYIPNLHVWFVESTVYPFIGGDSVKRKGNGKEGYLPAINMILPYAAPSFLGDAAPKAVYDLSMTSLENTCKLLLVLEEEYQNIFERKLTLKRLGEAVIAPRLPDTGTNVGYDMNQAPSVYVLNEIERLKRLEKLITNGKY